MRDIYIADRVTCADGWSISIQAGWTHYCSPRENSSYWSTYELGYPSAEEESILQYAEEADKPLETVYGYVPRDLVLNLIKKHGGPTVGECPPDARKKNSVHRGPRHYYDHKKTILSSLGFDVNNLILAERGQAVTQ